MSKKNKLCLVIAALLAIALATSCANNSPGESGTAPDFQFKGLDGQTVSLSGLKGKPVLLNFWATWCPPCRGEMPYLQQIYNDVGWKERGLVILAVNIQEPAAEVSKFMTDNKLSFPVLLDTAGDAARRYNVASIPSTFIIDKDGIIKDSRVGAFSNKAQTDSMLRDALD